MLDELSKHHKEWLTIAQSFMTSKEDAEDVVQDVYLKLYEKGVRFEDIRYKTNINKFFMYLAIRNHCIDIIRKKRIFVELNESMIIEYEPEDDLLQEKLDLIHEEIKKWDFYDRTLFEIYMYSGLSLRDLSNGSDKELRMISKYKELCPTSVKKGTGISVTSLFHNIKALKELIKANIK